MKLKILAILVILANSVFAQNYHDTQGKLEISGSGQATFNLPIAMPPSINNYGPKIDVNYASGQLSGIAGQGWNINGISKITRINTRLDIDGFIDGVDFDDNDKLALDGQRLIIKSGTYWADGTIYQTEIQSNLKIQQFGAGANIYFIVTMPDGTKNFYGNYSGNNATEISTYFLVRTEDTDGNFIIYDYLRPLNASLCINNIQFSANINSNPTPLNKIHFVYEEASRTENTYINGTQITKKERLKRIEVITSMTFFRKYEFTYNTDSNGYDKLIKYQEFNGNNEAANPIEFTYNSTEETSFLGQTGATWLPPNDISLIGDFNGDNSLDIVASNVLQFNVANFKPNSTPYRYNLTNNSKKIQANVVFNQKIIQHKSLVEINENINNLNFKINIFQTKDQFNFMPEYNFYEKNFNYDNVVTCVDYCSDGFGNCEEIDEFGNVIIVPCNTNDCPSPSKKYSNQYIEGDFNGDGLSEVLILGFTDIMRYGPISQNNGRIVAPIDPCVWVHEISKYPMKINLIDLRESESTVEGTKGNVNIENIVLFGNGNRYTIDYNGDGKSDLLCFNDEGSSGFYRVIGFKQLSTAPWVEIEVLAQGFIDKYSSSKEVFFGDYNGDSKTDLMIPEGELSSVGSPACNMWHIYYANPNTLLTNSFIKKSISSVAYNRLETFPSGQYFRNFYLPLDVNKDGKTDLVRLEMWHHEVGDFFNGYVWRNHLQISTYINKLGYVNGGDNLVNNYSSESIEINIGVENYNIYPLISNHRYSGKESDIVFLLKSTTPSSFPEVNGLCQTTIRNIYFNSNCKENSLLKTIKQSEGKIIDELTYSNMIPSDSNYYYGRNFDFYSSDNSLVYPLVELKGIFNDKLVSKVTNTSSGFKRNKDYLYKGLAIDLNGVGFLGFRKTAQTNWYLDSDTNKTWSVTETNPQLRGAHSSTFSFILNKRFEFNYIPNVLISKTFYNYNTSVVGILPYYALLKKETSIDYLSNISTEKEYISYSSDYFLPQLVTNKKYLGTTLNASSLQGKTSITYNYEDPTDNATLYIIGKPKEIHTVSELFVNTTNGYNVKFSNEKLFYQNNRLSKTEKTSNNSTEKIVEEFSYFPTNGLLQSKTIKAENTTSANAVSPRTTEYTYDSSNRFLKTVKAPDGLITTYNEYEPIYGLVKKETNPFGQSTLSLYDNWGKRTKVTDFLGKSITYTYSKNNGVYKTTQVGDDGSNSFVEQDVLSREIKRGSIDFNGNWNFVNTEYDQYGRKYRVSEPYNGFSSPTQWTTTEYDLYSRPIKVTSFTGKIISTLFAGTGVVVTEPTMTKRKYLNSLGYVIQSVDEPGGIINYKYDANGNLLESDYEGIKTTMTYDKWNRKETYLDSSMGLLTYTYDAFGQVKSETTPKGITVYTYDNFGKVLTKSIQGNTTADFTNIVSTYSYDPANKWLTNIAVVNPNDGNNNYAYTYDVTTKQLKKTIETLYSVGSTTPIVTFTKELTFDLFGRVDTETSTASAFSKSSTKTMKRTYKNGALWQLLDGATIKWQANTANARGQLTSLTLGNGINITNSYDNFGYLTQNKYDISTTNVMTFNTAFEPVLGNLTSRYNSLFDAKEEFKYDNLDRLISWDGGAQNILNLPFNTTTDGFTFTSTSTNGSVTNSAGTLKVVLKAPSDPDFPIAAQRNLALGLTNGNKIAIKATITNKTGTSGVIVNAVMVETDPADPSNYVEYVVGAIQNGAFEANYTVSDFVANPTLKLRFVISGDSPDSSNGGGIVSPFSTFYLDNLKIDKIIVNTQNYDNRGRITKNNLGSYSYDVASNRPYQNKKINLNTDANVYYASRQIQDVTYNAFKGIIQIEQPNFDKISFGYNGMEERSIMYWGNTNTNKFARPYRRYYSLDGSMEIKAIFGTGNTTVPASVEFITYLDGDAYSSNVILKSDGITQNYFYLHRDYQGSILAITNATGAVVEKRLFDAWGAIVKAQDGASNNLTKLTFFDRGYTGHEHLESVGLIHMNARLYDPKLHRFLQADNYIQDINNTQNYNRYGYCFNNPLKYTDPSGNFIQLGVAVIIAVGVALTTHIIQVSKNHQHLTFGGVMTTVSIAAFSSYATFGIGEMVSTMGNFYLQAGVQAVAHGTLQGGLTAMQGGKFWSGFAAGSISSIVSSAWAGDANHKGASGAFGFKGNNGITTGGTLFFGTISGGAGAALTGGNFWQGAVTGLIVSGLNHAMHGGFAKKFKFNVMLDENGARGAGHHAISGELDNGKYRFISKNGTLDPDDANYSGESDYTNDVFDSVDAIQKHYGTEITSGHSFNKIDTYLMTRNQMNRAFETGLSIAKQNYHLFTNSCTNVVSQSLAAAFGRPFLYDASAIPRLNHIAQRVNYYNHYIYSK